MKLGEPMLELEDEAIYYGSYTDAPLEKDSWKAAVIKAVTVYSKQKPLLLGARTLLELQSGQVMSKHIVTALAAFENHPRGFLVMEYHENTQSLSELLEARTLSTVQILEILAQVIDAIEYLHGKETTLNNN